MSFRTQFAKAAVGKESVIVRFLGHSSFGMTLDYAPGNGGGMLPPKKAFNSSIS